MHSSDLSARERLQANLSDDIAQAALDFGQEDDITVLTIMRISVGERSITFSSSSGLSPSLA